MVLDPHAVLDQEEAAPALRVIQLFPLVDRRPRWLGDVGDESGRCLGQRGASLVTDFRGRRLERGEPRELIPVEELDRRQAGKLQECRLWSEPLPAADKGIQAGVEALEPGTCMLRARLLQPW